MADQNQPPPPPPPQDEQPPPAVERLTAEESRALLELYDKEKAKNKSSTLGMCAVVGMVLVVGTVGMSASYALTASQEILKQELANRAYELQNERLEIALHDRRENKKLEMKFKLAEMHLRRAMLEYKNTSEIPRKDLQLVIQSFELVPRVKREKVAPPANWYEKSLKQLLLQDYFGLIIASAFFIAIGIARKRAYTMARNIFLGQVLTPEEEEARQRALIEQRVRENRERLYRQHGINPPPQGGP